MDNSSSSSLAAAAFGGTSVDTLPVHEFWLEHKRALALELQAQRSSMLYEVANSQRSALLGTELVRCKLEEDIESFYTEYRKVLTAVNATLQDGWRKVQNREKALFTLQQQLNDGLATHLRAAKEAVMRNAELEISLAERREQLEQWASNCQEVILRREEELGATARKLDSDMSAIMIARKRLQNYDQQLSTRTGTVALIVPAPGSNHGVVRIGASSSLEEDADGTETTASRTTTAATTRKNGLNLNSAPAKSGEDAGGGGEEGVIQVPVGEPFDLEFQLQMNPMPETLDRSRASEYPVLADFTNIPCTISYIEGKKGVLWGTVQTLVTESGKIKLQGVRLQGVGGSSHVLLVSIPRNVHGYVHPLEMRVHLYTIPKIDVVGAWKPDVRALVGRIRIRHAEPFSIVGRKMQLQLVIRNAHELHLEEQQRQARAQQQQQQRLRSGSVGSNATSAASGGTQQQMLAASRTLRTECEGDAQGDFSFSFSLPGHVWEELEQSVLSLEFRTPHLVAFPALEHHFDVHWMHVNSRMGTTPRSGARPSVDGSGNQGEGYTTKVPMFRHPPEELEPLSFSTFPAQFPKTDLITDFAISDSANLLLLSDVGNKVLLLRYEYPQKWVLARTLLLPVESAHIGGVAFSRSGNLFAVHDTVSKTISVWSVQKVLKTATSNDGAQPEELDPADFVVDYTTVAPRANANMMAHLTEDLLATHVKPIEDVLGTSLLVFTPATGLHLFFAGGADGKAAPRLGSSLTAAAMAAASSTKRPTLLVEPRGQNAVRHLFHKVLPAVGSMAILGYDNGEVVATATAATKATGKRVQFRFSVVKGSPIAAISDGPTPDSFLCCTICTVCIVKTQPTWSVLRCSYVTSSPIAAVSFGGLPPGVLLDSEEKDGCAVVVHTSGLVAAVGIVTGCILGSAMLPDVGEDQTHASVGMVQCAGAAHLGARLATTSSLKPSGWEIKLISPAGENEPGAKPPVPVLFEKQKKVAQQA